MVSHDQSRIADRHRNRTAAVYVRQSDEQQVREHDESARVQRALREVAVDLGWPSPTIIEDDLGISACGFADRPGFQRLLTDVAMRVVGIIVCFDASRLSRNSKDWAHLFELCGHFDVLVADLQQVYDLSVPNDRLVLSIRGTIAEMELQTIQDRVRASIKAKASRGELKFIVPPGYAHDIDRQIVIDPDQQVQHAIRTLFERFERSTSIRQVALWYRDTKTLFPVRKIRNGCPIAWEVPTGATLINILEHPIYAGAYTHGRRQVTIEYSEGKLIKRTRRRRSAEDCPVCIKDHHEAYISWDQYEKNRAKIAEARPRWAMEQNRGAVRNGLAILAGVLRCGKCGRRLYVIHRKTSALYFCDGGEVKGSKRCISFGSKTIDELVGDELCRAVAPSAIDAAQTACAQMQHDQQQIIKQAQLHLHAAQYQADRAFEQYNLADPKNRLVVDSLEKRLNDRLQDVGNAQRDLDAALQAEKPLTDDQVKDLEHLGRNFPLAWNDPHASASLRKQLIRAAIVEVIVVPAVDKDELDITIHWQGGEHTQLRVGRPKRSSGCCTAEAPPVEMIRSLAPDLSDPQIARVLNMKKIPTPRGLRWTKDRVCSTRKHHDIPSFDEASNNDHLTWKSAADYLEISRSSLRVLVRQGLLTKNQVTDFAPWRISRQELDSETVQAHVRQLKAGGRVPREGGCFEAQQELFPIISGVSPKEAL